MLTLPGRPAYASRPHIYLSRYVGLSTCILILPTYRCMQISSSNPSIHLFLFVLSFCSPCCATSVWIVDRYVYRRAMDAHPKPSPLPLSDIPISQACVMYEVCMHSYLLYASV